MKKSTAVLGGIQALALVTALANVNAFADTTTNTTTAPAQDTAPQGFLSKMAVSFWSQYNGPAIANPSAYLVDEYGRTKDSQQYFNSSFTFAYKFTSDFSAGLFVPMNYRPVGGQDIRLKDPALTVARKNVIKSGGFTLSSTLRAAPGVTSVSRDKDQLLSLVTLQSANYAVPNTRLTVGIFGAGAYYAYGSAAAEDATVLDMYLAPNLSYQISQTVAATAYYELDGTYAQNSTGLFRDWSNGGTDLQLGASWDVTPSFNFNPFLMLQTGGKVSFDSTSFGAYISAKLL